MLESAALQVMGMRDYETMTDSQRMDAIKKEFLNMLSATSKEFKDQYEEDVSARLSKEASAKAGAEIKDLDEGTMIPEYQAYLADLDEQYKNAGMGGIDDIRKNNPKEWKRVQDRWQEIWDEMEGNGLKLPATGPLGIVPSP